MRQQPQERVPRERHVVVEPEGTLTLDRETVSLPRDFREKLKLVFDDSIRFGEIEIVPPEMLAAKKPTLGTTGYPRFGSIIANGTRLRLSPVPDQAYVAKVYYVGSLVALSDTATTNWLLASHPDIYLYASLVESAPYLKDDERIALWKTERGERIAELGGFRTRQRSGGNAPRLRPRRAIG